jgi:hypothetical protein
MKTNRSMKSQSAKNVFLGIRLSLHRSIHLGTIALLLLSSVLSFPIHSQAQNSAPKPKTTRKIRWKPPKPPSSLGTATGTEQGAGQRSSCKQYEGMRVLAPQMSKNLYWGKTISDRPTIWLTAPNGLEADLLMEIAIRDENGKPIFKHLFKTPQTPSGVFSVTFPNQLSLQQNRTYRWNLLIYCDSESEDKPITLQGQIQRTSLAQGSVLPSNQLERAELLAEQGIWYDALTQLGEGIRAQPTKNLITAWGDLLQSAAIEAGHDSVKEPIQDCCELKTP